MALLPFGFTLRRVEADTPCMLTLDTLSAEQQAWFVHYKRSGRPPTQMRAEMALRFGEALAWDLAALFEREAIPPRPGQWRRRTH